MEKTNFTIFRGWDKWKLNSIFGLMLFLSFGLSTTATAQRDCDLTCNDLVNVSLGPAPNIDQGWCERDLYPDDILWQGSCRLS